MGTERIDHFRYIKFILCFEAWGNKTKEMYYLLLSLKMISFVLFPQAKYELLVYCQLHLIDTD